jgi:hypothetical protein
MIQGVASSALYWSADEVGSQTPGRLRPGDLSLRYTSCHIRSICFRRSPLRSCLVLYAKFWGRVELGRLGESSGRSSEGRVGCQLGRLGPLTGRLVFSRPNPLVGDGREPSRPPRPSDGGLLGQVVQAPRQFLAGATTSGAATLRPPNAPHTAGVTASTTASADM